MIREMKKTGAKVDMGSWEITAFRHPHITSDFLRGQARSFDLYGVSRRWPDLSDSWKKDAEALKGDCSIVSKEFQKAISSYKFS